MQAARRAGRRGQGPALRPVRGQPGHHPPRPRRAPGQRPADRVLAVDPRRRGRDPAAAARARHRLRALLARSATACSPGRSAPSTTSPTTTGARPTRGSPARTSSATSRIVDEVQAIGAEIGATPAQTALAWLLTRGDGHRPHPRHPPRRPRRGEHRGRRRRAHRRPARTGSTTSSPPRASGTTRPTWHRSTADPPTMGPRRTAASHAAGQALRVSGCVAPGQRPERRKRRR